MEKTPREIVLQALSEKLPEVSAATLEECMGTAAEYFCSKTKRKKVPLSAVCLWRDMALRIHSIAGGDTTTTVSAVKRGDINIQYDTSVVESMTDLESRVMQFRVVRAI